MSNNLPAVPATKKLLLNDADYDKLKFVAQIFLPALAAFYSALALIWGLPASTQVVGTVVAVDTLLGAFLSLSTKVYNAQPNPPIQVDGNLHVVESDTSLALQLEVLTPPEEMAKQKTVTLRVMPKQVGAYQGDFPEDHLK